MYVQPIFILVNVSDKQITTSENITLRRREFVVSEDGNLFYRAVAFRKDEIGGENMRKSLGRVMVCLRIIQRFWSCRFSPQTETVDIPSVVHRSLSDPFVPTHRRRRKGSVLSRLSTLVRSH